MSFTGRGYKAGKVGGRYLSILRNQLLRVFIMLMLSLGSKERIQSVGPPNAQVGYPEDKCTQDTLGNVLLEC